MSFLANHPKLGLCVVSDSRYLSLEEALFVNAKKTNELLEEGDIHTDVAFIGDKCYSGTPECKFWIDTPIQYPSTEEVSEVTRVCMNNGATLVKRSFGNYEFVSYAEELIDKLDKELKESHPNWKVVRPAMPKPTDAVLSTDEIQAAVISVDIEQESNTPMQTDIIPEQCRGESWSFSVNTSLYLDDVTDDGYCIENNWEPRGDYWIFDCISRGKRLIHSDTLGYNKEFSIELCG